jgi:hypothetical protein
MMEKKYDEFTWKLDETKRKTVLKKILSKKKERKNKSSFGSICIEKKGIKDEYFVGQRLNYQSH